MLECNSKIIRRSFLEWNGKYKPDKVSRKVLSILLDKYEKGDKEQLFLKFKQLIEGECYKLATIFKSCFIYIGINEEFIQWMKNTKINR